MTDLDDPMAGHCEPIGIRAPQLMKSTRYDPKKTPAEQHIAEFGRLPWLEGDDPE